jgi:transcriptional pleiotropic regulator of transition state genes
MVKSTGVVRKVDDLGRVVIPMELRRTLGIGEKDPMEIFVDGDRIVLKRYTPGCSQCGEIDVPFFGPRNNICEKCIKKMSAEIKA